MEVTGVVLGAVPIVLEVLKQYQTLFRICRRFKRCRNGVEHLIDCLETQKAIFSNETLLLLIAALGPTKAKNMIHELNDPSWNEVDTVNRLESFLGDSKDAIVIAGNNVKRSMSSLEARLRDLRLDDTSSCLELNKSFRRELRRRFEYAFSKQELNEISDDVTQSTTRYRTLRSQLTEIAASQSGAEVSESNDQTLQQVSATQVVARQLCRMLPKACNLHTKHFARFSLEPQYTTTNGTVTEIKLHIAYRHLPEELVQRQHQMLWFTVESMLCGLVQRCQTTTPPDSKSSRGKRTLSPTLLPWDGSVERQPKRVHFQSPPRTPSPRSFETLVSSNGNETAMNFGSINDFCTRLRSRTGCMDRTCIGWLEDSRQWKHRVYPSEGPHKQNILTDTKSLAAFFTTKRASECLRSKIPYLQRLQMAKMLASAMLNYHSTPLTQWTWSSRDIFLYNTDLAYESPTPLKLNAFLEISMEYQANEAGGRMVSDGLAPYVRNPGLFGLAVILLELAYEKSLHEMIEASDSKPGLPSHTRVLFAMRRLSKEVRPLLGIRYSRVVEKCLECDFGEGTNLDNPLLQAAIQRDVIQELDELVAGFEKMALF